MKAGDYHDTFNYYVLCCTASCFQFNFEHSDDEDSRKKKKHGDDYETEGSDDDGSSDDEKQSRKRGGNRLLAKAKIKGFTQSELRRFIKSYRKFARPQQMLEVIAADAELQEKSPVDLKRLSELIDEQCQLASEEFEQKLKEEPTTGEGEFCGGNWDGSMIDDVKPSVIINIDVFSMGVNQFPLLIF